MKALKDIFDRLFGTPTRQVDMQLNAEVDIVSILQQRRARARQRGKDCDPNRVRGWGMP